MATIRIEDEQISGKGYADGLCGFADLRTDMRVARGRSTVTPSAFNKACKRIDAEQRQLTIFCC